MMGIFKLKRPNNYEMFTLQFMGIADLKLTSSEQSDPSSMCQEGEMRQLKAARQGPLDPKHDIKSPDP